MGVTYPTQVGFNGGQVDALMAGRSDLARLRMACSRLSNFVPTVQGPAIKRSGSRFVKAVIDVAHASRLLPFEYSRDQAYVIELAAGKIRFMRDEGAVLETAVAISAATPPTIANPCVITTNVAHGYATGDQIFISGSRLAFINSQFFDVTVTGASTFTISQFGGAAISSLGEVLIAAGTNTVARVYTISNGVGGNAIPWAEADLPGIQFAQDADVMYLTHPSYPPHKLVRTSDTSWACTAITFAWPCFREENITTTTVYASAATGAGITITASSAIFTSDMIGGYIAIGEVIDSVRPPWTATSTMSSYFSGGGVAVGDWVRSAAKVYELKDKHGGSNTGELAPVHDYGNAYDTARTSSNFEWTFINRGWGYATITAIGGGGTTATATVVVTLPKSALTSATATRKWKMGAFSAEYGYPRGVALFEQRLWFAGTDGDPDVFWGSRTNRFEDFERIPGDASGGLQYRLASSQRNEIQALVGADSLILCTQGGESTADGGAQDDAISGDNIKVRQRSAYGCAQNVSPKFVDSAMLMIHRNQKRLMELLFDFDTDRYKGADLTATSSRIIDGLANGLDYQASPYRQVLVKTEAGELFAVTYVREDEVSAWYEIELGNAAGSAPGFVESMCVIPHPDGDEDQLWLIVKRTLNGNTRRYIEFIEKPFASNSALADAFFSDSGVTQSGAASTTMYGLLHLAGNVVTILADGVAATGLVGSKGYILLGSATPVLSASSKIQAGFAMSAQLETVDFETGQPPYSSALGDRGRVVGATIRVDTMGEGLQVGQSLSGTMDAVANPFGADPFTGDVLVSPLPGGFTRNRRVALKHETALPCTIVAINAKVVEEKS